MNNTSPSAASPSGTAPWLHKVVDLSSSRRIVCWPPSTTPEDPATRHSLLTKPIVIGHWCPASLLSERLDRCQCHHTGWWEFSSGERREGSLRPSSIDKNTIVAAGAVVSKDVPACRRP